MVWSKFGFLDGCQLHLISKEPVRQLINFPFYAIDVKLEDFEIEVFGVLVGLSGWLRWWWWRCGGRRRGPGWWGVAGITGVLVITVVITGFADKVL